MLPPWPWLFTGREIKKENMTFTTKSTEETEELGFRFGSTLKRGDVVSLRGSLGAGKTVLAKGIAKSLGITEAVVSPTFTLVQ